MVVGEVGNRNRSCSVQHVASVVGVGEEVEAVHCIDLCLLEGIVEEWLREWSESS